jgi:hypothetical protein
MAILRGRLPTTEPDKGELVEVPQRNGSVLMKRRGDLDFNDLNARAPANGDVPQPTKKQIRSDNHKAELQRLKKLRDNKGSGKIGKVSVPPQGLGISWSPRCRVMKRSRVWASLGIYHHRMLDALECEHEDHGGKQNGCIIFTFDDGEKAGIPRRCFKRTMDDLICVGLVKKEHQGRCAGGARNEPNLYRLTYLPYKIEDISGRPLYLYPSNEWIDVELDMIAGKRRSLKGNRQPPSHSLTKSNRVRSCSIPVSKNYPNATPLEPVNPTTASMPE